MCIHKSSKPIRKFSRLSVSVLGMLVVASKYLKDNQSLFFPDFDFLLQLDVANSGLFAAPGIMSREMNIVS